MTREEIKKELRRCIKYAVRVVGGTGGQVECVYCLKRSWPGRQHPHYRKDGKESDEHCEATVMEAALKALR
jgi:hypothetical protein